MTELEKLKQELAAIQKRIDNLEEPHEFVVRERYLFVDGAGRVEGASWLNDSHDLGRLQLANAFPLSQRKEAERFAGELKLRAKLLSLNNGFVPDWGDDKQPKHSVMYCNRTKDVSVGKTYFCQEPLIVLFASQEDADNAANQTSDDFRKLYGGE